MIFAQQQSGWRFKTSGTGGVGVEFLAAQGGVIDLLDLSGKVVRLRMGALGVGYSYGFKLPRGIKIPPIKLGKLNGSAALAPTWAKNWGWVWKTSACCTSDLTHSDFCGPVIFLDAGASILLGFNGDVMIMGMDKLLVVEMIASSGAIGTIVNPDAAQKAFQSAKAVLVSCGFGGTLSAAAGGAVFMGDVW